MQCLDNWVSAGDICEARPCDPGKNALKVGGKLPLPLHHGLQDSPTAAQQTQLLQKIITQPSMKKNENGVKQNKRRNKIEEEEELKIGRYSANVRTEIIEKRENTWIKSNRNREKETCGRQIVQKYEKMIGLNCASQAWLSLTPLAPHEIIFILYESKGSPVENERLHKPEPKTLEWERRRAPLQGPCCYSKHLPLCGRSSRPIVVQKLVVLPLAPFGSRGMRQTPLLFWFRYVVGYMRGPGYHHHWLWPFALSQHSIVQLFLIYSQLFTSQEHFQANSPVVFSLFLLYSYSCFSFGVYAYCSLEHPHYTHGYILRASLFDFGLVGSWCWAGGSCRAGPAFRAPQPVSQRAGLGVLLGWALLQKHWRYC